MKLSIVLDAGAFMPEKAHEQDAGYDLKSPETVVVNARSYVTIDTGVHIAIPIGYVGFLKSKSGLNVKKHIVSEGVIDAGYTGSIRVKLYNHGFFNYEINKGDKITQLVILPFISPELVQVEELEETERGSAGFGSSGR